MTTIEIHIVRDRYFYFYNRYEDGETVIFAERITRARARQIVETSKAEGAAISSRGDVIFDPDNEAQFSFISKWNNNENNIPQTFELLSGFICPPEFWPAFEYGYGNDARFVGIYWEQAGDEASFYDGRFGLCGANWQAYLLLINTNFPISNPPAPARSLTGSSDSLATHWIVIDRKEEVAWLAPRNSAEAFLREHWLPVDEEVAQ